MKAFNNLFYCTSALQLLTAFEARSTFGGDNNLMILNSDPDEASLNNLSSLTSTLAWSEIRYLNRQRKSRFLAQLRITRELEEGRFNRIFIGEWSSFARILFHNLRFDEAYLLDDGTATIRQQRELCDPDRYLGLKKRLWDKYRDFRFKAFGLKTSSQRELKFYSAFIKEKISSEKIIVHSFNYLRSQFNGDGRRFIEKTAFIGTNLIGAGLCDASRMQLLHQFFDKNFSPGEIVDYYLHRSENENLLRAYLTQSRYNLIPYRGPLELNLLAKDATPRTVVSTISSALVTIKVMFPDIQAVALDVSQLTGRSGPADWFYDLFEQHNIQVIKVPLT